jgi:hypothetical protein
MKEMEEVEMIPMSEIGWIAGFLEGEGYFTLVGSKKKTPRIEAVQVDISPIDRLYDRFGGKMWLEKRGGELGRYRGNRQPCWKWYADPSTSIQIMMTIWPLVGTKRREEIEKVIEVWKEAEIVPGVRTDWKNCGSSLDEKNIEWRSREDGKGRRKWCKNCGRRVGD